MTKCGASCLEGDTTSLMVLSLVVPEEEDLAVDLVVVLVLVVVLEEVMLVKEVVVAGRTVFSRGSTLIELVGVAVGEDFVNVFLPPGATTSSFVF